MTKDWVHGVGYSPVSQILLQIVVRAVISASPPAWTRSAGMLSTPADFPFFNDCTTAFISVRRMGWSSSVSVCGQFITDWSPLVLWFYSSSVQYLSFFYKAFSWAISGSISFPFFHSSQSFTSWYALLLLFFLRFSWISLHCFPIRFSFALLCTSQCCCSLAGICLRPFRFKSFISNFVFLSHRSEISAVM